jgi:hypothetical protein
VGSFDPFANDGNPAQRCAVILSRTARQRRQPQATNLRFNLGDRPPDYQDARLTGPVPDNRRLRAGRDRPGRTPRGADRAGDIRALVGDVARALGSFSALKAAALATGASADRHGGEQAV